MPSKQVHLNDPQVLVNLVRAQVTLFFGGRAVGKTHGAGSTFTARNVGDMPKGNHYIASSSYEKVLNDVLPKIQKGWADLGYYENQHYWVRKWAPDKLRIPKPFLAPTTAHYIIHWFNGAANPLISADRPSLFVGKDGDSIYGDEMRLWKKESFEQLRLNIRGNVDKFGHLSNHLSELYTTDLPRDRKGDFLFEFEKESNEEIIEAIIMAEQQIYEFNQELKKCRTKKRAREIKQCVNVLTANCNELRRELVHVIYASSLENMEVLGLDLLWKWKKTMSQESFAVSVLTQRQKTYGQFFYSMFNQQDHCYSSSNFEIIDQLDSEGYQKAPWSMTQKDLKNDKPLQLSGDFNAAIVYLVVGQTLPRRLNIVGSLWVVKPKKIKDLAVLFDFHFKDKKKYNNEVIFHYDQTAIGKNPMNDNTFLKEWKKCLQGLGWAFRENYIGAAPEHTARYELLERLFDHTDLSTSNLYINKNTNLDLIKSMEDAPVVRAGRNDFRKDKRSEYSKTIPAQHATHGSEAFDILAWGCEVDPYRSSPGFINTLTGL